MKIHTKTGVMTITLRPLGEEKQGDCSIPDRGVGILVDIKYVADDGKRKWPVTSGPNDPIDYVVPGDHPFYFTSDQVALDREYQRE